MENALLQNRPSVCEVCGQPSLQQVLQLGNHPLCDDLKKSTVNEKTQEFPIDILFCSNCNTAHQGFQVPKSVLFPETYHYRSRLTKDVLAGMQDLADQVIRLRGSVNQIKVLDIGCNDGSLLNIFRDFGSVTIGVEPTSAANDCDKEKHLIYRDYFTPELAQEIRDTHGFMDVITFTNVFAHIEELPRLLTSINTLMKDSTLLVIENHYLGSILDGSQFDTFYHEHPRTYSLNSFKYVADALKVKIVSVEFPSRYGGNIRVALSRTKAMNYVLEEIQVEDIIRSEKMRFPKQISQLQSVVEIWQKEKRLEINRLVQQYGPLPGKAFPGRAAILVKLLDLTSKDICCIYEQPTSPKIGHYVPGTDIPIRSDLELFSQISSTKVIINFAWHIPIEIKRYLSENQYEGEIISIV